MKRPAFLFVALPLFIACQKDAKVIEDAGPAASVVPMGMASAATLVAATNKVEVLAKLHRPRDLVLAGDQVFAIDLLDDSGASDIVALAGGAAKPVVGGQPSAQGLAWASGRLVWVVMDQKSAPTRENLKAKPEGAKIVAAKPDATKATLVTKTYGLDETLSASDGTDVFTFGDVKDDKCDLLRITAAGKAERVTTAGPRVVRRALAVNASHIFWVQDGAIVSAPKAGGATAVLAKLPSPKIQRLVADATSVYWTDLGTGDPAWSGRVYRMPVAGGKPDTLSDAPSPVGLAVDADTVYWTASVVTGGRVLAQKKTGGATVVLAKDQHAPRFLVVDAKYAYWTNEGDAEVFRTEKVARSK